MWGAAVYLHIYLRWRAGGQAGRQYPGGRKKDGRADECKQKERQRERGERDRVCVCVCRTSGDVVKQLMIAQISLTSALDFAGNSSVDAAIDAAVSGGGQGEWEILRATRVQSFLGALGRPSDSSDRRQHCHSEPMLTLTVTPTALVTLPESIWRPAALAHTERMRALVSPGFVETAEHLTHDKKPSRRFRHANDGWRALDPRHPVYNFMLEYYALKGAKSTRRLGRWSPALSADGVLLEGASSADIDCDGSHRARAIETRSGICYDPREFQRGASREQCSSFLWYRSILSATSDAAPVLHCFGLHEWAMQYQPEGAPPPPSAKYQAHLPLRVSREQINAAVERSGVSCTHVDALRYFAPAAAPLNKHGSTLQRSQQPDLEQPACARGNGPAQDCAEAAPMAAGGARRRRVGGGD